MQSRISGSSDLSGVGFLKAGDGKPTIAFPVILSALKSEASKLPKQLNGINSAIEILGGKNGVSRGKHPKKRRMSASVRARIAKAQRARWAKVRATKKNG